VKVAVLKFWQFIRPDYLTMGQCRKWQDSDYESARYDRGVASPFVGYGESNFKRLVYVKGIGRSYQSNVSHNQVWAELESQSFISNLALLSDRVQSAQRDTASPHGENRKFCQNQSFQL
jgi:hypothetical protein